MKIGLKRDSREREEGGKKKREEMECKWIGEMNNIQYKDFTTLGGGEREKKGEEITSREEKETTME